MNLVKLEDDKNEKELVVEDDSAYKDEWFLDGLSTCAQVGLSIYNAYDCVADSDDKIEDFY